MFEDENNYYCYWGKAKKDDQIQGEHYHLLVYHSLDVATCGECLLSEHFNFGRNIANKLGIPLPQLQRIFAFLLSIHDIGKFARAFQNLAPNLSSDLVPYDAHYCYTERHDSLGFWLVKCSDEIKELLADLLGIKTKRVATNETLTIWLQIVMGHHGKPPKGGLKDPRQFFSEEDINASVNYIKKAADYWLTSEDFPLLVDKSMTQCLRVCSWSLAGLAVLADWQGSNQFYFPYQSAHQPLDSYVNQARFKAHSALNKIGLESSHVSSFSSINQLFPFIKAPTPLQQYAIEQPLTNGPQLFILEDVTGAGKTEAALTLVHRIFTKNLAKGLYVGLPTMATANAMYHRLVSCYRQLFVTDKKPSLVLSHGARHLSEEFRKSVILQEQPTDDNYQSAEYSASAFCNMWIADNRKKALLADVGVGTLDQALLSILPVRHQSLRLLGLANKVLLIDEVHAYDAYMQTLLARLLKLHAAQGGSAILLSATLPQVMKQKLTAAFAEGLALSAPELGCPAYPLATQFPVAKGVTEQPLATRNELCRHIEVRRLADEEQALVLIGQYAAQGNTVCWIRNTVDEAKAAYYRLCQLEDNTRVQLFHSRFAMVDRQKIEQKVLTTFGKFSDAQQRQGQILIATQVVEQSLDLDFDVMISDLAPVDLLLQRAGRLHRHRRQANGNIQPAEQADQRGQPCLYVVSPVPDNDVTGDWLPKTSGSRLVYRDLGLLWRSAKVLFENKGYQMPDDARQLIEDVYSPDTVLDTPEELLESSFETEGEQRAAVSIAFANELDIEQGYSQSSSGTGWGEKVNTPTRLSEPTVSVALLTKNAQGQWLPYADETSFPWELSQLSLRESQWQKAEKALTPDIIKQLHDLQEQTPALRWQQLFPLVEHWQTFYSSQLGWVGENPR